MHMGLWSYWNKPIFNNHVSLLVKKKKYYLKKAEENVCNALKLNKKIKKWISAYSAFLL